MARGLKVSVGTELVCVAPTPLGIINNVVGRPYFNLRYRPISV